MSLFCTKGETLNQLLKARMKSQHVLAAVHIDTRRPLIISAFPTTNDSVIVSFQTARRFMLYIFPTDANCMQMESDISIVTAHFVSHCRNDFFFALLICWGMSTSHVWAAQGLVWITHVEYNYRRLSKISHQCQCIIRFSSDHRSVMNCSFSEMKELDYSVYCCHN